jgi:hypothetical protein
MVRVIEELASDWRRLDQRVDGLSGEIEVLARQDQACSRLMTVPSIGPIISSAMVAAIGTGDVFSKGRDFGAWLGLVPKQISTGDRTILGKISRRGNRYLRVSFVQAALVVLVKIKNWEHYGLKSWIEAAKRRLHHNVLAIALANKLARIASAVLAKGRSFEASKLAEVAAQPSRQLPYADRRMRDAGRRAVAWMRLWSQGEMTMRSRKGLFQASRDRGELSVELAANPIDSRDDNESDAHRNQRILNGCCARFVS